MTSSKNQHVAAVLTATGRIAAATKRVTGSCRILPILYSGPGYAPKLPLPFHWGIRALAMVSLVHPSPHPTRHLDWLSRFSTAPMVVTNRQTHRYGDRRCGLKRDVQLTAACQTRLALDCIAGLLCSLSNAWATTVSLMHNCNRCSHPAIICGVGSKGGPRGCTVYGPVAHPVSKHAEFALTWHCDKLTTTVTLQPGADSE